MNKSYKKKFQDLFGSLCGSRPKFTVWYDCIQVWAFTISNSCNYRQDREDAYLSIVGKYTKEEVNKMAELFAIIILALDENMQQDFLGELYMEYGFGDVKKGEFFTPYNIAYLMSEMIGDGRETTEDYVTINEPACGSGVMIIAYINKLIKDKHSPHLKALIIANDSDPCIALMCYIQISLLGAAGYVCIQNTLIEPMVGEVLYPPKDAFITPLFSHPIWQLRKIKSKI